MRSELQKLTTYGYETIPDIPWDSYPRPQMRRDSFICLNGLWDLAVTPPGSGSVPEQFYQTVRVPFPVESALSGVEKHFPEGSSLWYSRTLPGITHSTGELVLLHIDAVDQEADVYVNGSFAAHIQTFGGRNGIDITSFLNDRDLSEQDTLLIRVTDDLNRKEFPYGKQTLKRGGMWYTPFSGIWQSVWIEIVPAEYIRSIRITPSLTEARIEIDGPSEGHVIFEENEITFTDGHCTLAPKEPIYWTPDDPKLYEFTVISGADTVHSYFALRTLSTKVIDGIPRLCLNGQPYFFHGLLDQGYWPDGICTPPAPECFAEDILAMKDLGFNTLRKHIKVEPEQFYYDCDRLGMIVFQDMVNNGEYSFFRDTALPTVGIKKLNDHRLNTDPNCRLMFLRSMQETVNMLHEHPCICLWTIFNEGWGQFEADKAYEMLKKLDDSRFIDTASGWFRPEESDVTSLHVYFRKFQVPESEKPVLLSEFGGYSCKLSDHSFNLSKTYGYRFFRDQSQYMDALERLYRDEIIPAVKTGLCGAVYTQVSDIEDETNGLLTYDRAVCKAHKERMRAIAEMLQI